MKQGIVKFSKEFVTETGLKEWAGIELPFNEERESGVDALRRAETIVNEYQRQKSYLIQYETTSPPQLASLKSDETNFEDRHVGLTPELIMGCPDISTLQTFYLLVDKSNRVDVKEAYAKRKEELVAKETEEILAATNAYIKNK